MKISLSSPKTSQQPLHTSKKVSSLPKSLGAALLLSLFLSACSTEENKNVSMPPNQEGSRDNNNIPPKTDQPKTIKTNPHTSFVLPIMPDTQKYSENGRPLGKEMFMAQTNWLKDNWKAADGLDGKAPMVIHLGDVVEHPNKEIEWNVAKEAMKILDDAGIYYSILAGNHDIAGKYSKDRRDREQPDNETKPAEEPFLKANRFNPDELKNPLRVEVDETKFNTAYVFEAEGNKYLVLAMHWRTSEKSRKWASDLLKSDKYKEMPTILTSHEILDINRQEDDMSKNGIMTPHGEKLWNELINENDQIFMTINGHNHGAARLTKTNKYGHDVHMIMTNYQAEYNGGNGLLRFAEFDIPNNTVRMMTMSPYVKNLKPEELSGMDKVKLSDKGNDFDIKINFAERFKGFAPNWKIPEAKDLKDNEVTVLDKINATLTNWKGKESDLIPAKNEQDYKNASGTLAHWRFVGKEGQPVGNIEDISGNGNTLFFKKERGDLAQPDIFTKDHSPYSAAMGSVCRYSNNNGYKAPVSYWKTAPDSPLNAEQFEKGFTIEYFIKLDKRFNGSDPSKGGTLEQKEASNKGMGILSRAALRYEGADEPIFKNVISNLRELEYSSAPADISTNKTSYSWSLGLNEWTHIAIVGDENGSQLYVNGSTDMRSRDGALKFPGINNADGKPEWIIGALFDGRIHTDGSDTKDGEKITPGVRNSFSGCIGEMRITDHKLDVSDFLTARK